MFIFYTRKCVSKKKKQQEKEKVRLKRNINTVRQTLLYSLIQISRDFTT